MAATLELSRDITGLRRSDESAYGGKSIGLGELCAAGLKVPAGFALSTSALDHFLTAGGLGEMVARETDGIDPGNIAALERTAAAVARAMRRAPMPDEIHGEIRRAYQRLGRAQGCADPPVAVRSSGLGEDSAASTYAGQQETYLWVRGVDAVCGAVRDCWTSLFSAHALSYRARMSSGEEAVRMGVVVQVMIDAAVAGVMFTCSPTTGDPSVVAIDATWGLGLGVVGGEITPDHFSLSKLTGEVLTQKIAGKHHQYTAIPNGSGVRLVTVPAGLVDTPSLNHRQLAALISVARRADRHFGLRQDLEWALGRSGDPTDSLYILQCRPVTTAHRESPTLAANATTMHLLLQSLGSGSRGAADGV